jgi:ferredoxin
MSYRPEIDLEACGAHGECEMLAPDVFELTDVARVVGDGPDDVILLAARECPVLAIRVIDETSGKQVYP